MNQSADSNGIYYFLGNITSHILHALPLHKELGGTFVVLSDKAKKEIERYNVPVINIDNKPRQWTRFSRWVAKPYHHYVRIGADLKKTTDFLNANAKVVIFYEPYDFAPSVRLTKPKTIFLTHGYMLKDYMHSSSRMEIIKQYDYMAAIGPGLKRQFIADGIDPAKLVDIGIARTDDIVKHSGKVALTPSLADGSVLNPAKPILAYLPTFWGASSIYDTGLELVKYWPDEYNLIFRPHPQTPGKLLRQYLNLIKNKPNIIYAPEGKYPGIGLVEIFDASSAIIGDISSVMAEAVLANKPLLFVYGVGPNKQGYDSYAAIRPIVEASVQVDKHNVADIKTILATSLSQPIDYGAHQQVANQLFYNASGGSTAAIAKFIKSLE